MGKFARLGNELYNGEKSIDFIGKAAVWYLISAILVLGSVGIVVGKGLNLGIEFTGGTQLSVEIAGGGVTEDDADAMREAVADSGVDVGDPIVTTQGDAGLIVQTEELTNEQTSDLIPIVGETAGIAEADYDDAVSVSEIGASLGAQIAQRAGLGIAVFLVLVVLFIWAYFREWKMSIAALVALFHDIALTVGVYALSGFSVTPAAVTGLLAILGFSLYDTVVVFDKVRENTKNLRSSRMSYAEAANLAVNQTLVRSINTAIVALIPIGAILYVSAVQLGASSLQDLALSQFVGMGVGVYSSIALAPRVLVALKSTETEVKQAEKRAKARDRAAADRYAAVPVFTEDMAVGEDPESTPPAGRTATAVLDEETPAPRATPPSTRRQPPEAGRGRTVPEAKGPISDTNASGRKQPSRKPKSQRGK